MKTKSWLLLISSALLYALAFMQSESLWWLTFIFPVPLFYVALHEKLLFVHGYVWAAISLALHLSGVIQGIFLMSEGNLVLRMLPGIFIVLYEALYGGIWFWLMAFGRKKLKLKLCSVHNLLLWVVGLWAWAYFMDYYCLWLFDLKEGYFFMHPILPLAEKPALLQALPLLGKQLVTFNIYAVSACITALIVWPQKVMLLALVISLVPWLISWYRFCPQAERPAWLSRVAPFQVSYSSTTNIERLAHAIRDDINKLLSYYKDADIVMYPESSFYEKNLFNADQLPAWWNEQAFGKPLHIIGGSFVHHNEGTCNCLYWVYNGQVQQCFKKRHAMLLTERVPSWFNHPAIRSLYFNEHRAQITICDNERPCLQLDDDIALVPYICSELFFQEYPDDSYSDAPILSASNDSWCPVDYVPRLMYLVARYRALAWQRGVLFISFKHAAWIDSKGRVVYL